MQTKSPSDFRNSITTDGLEVEEKQQLDAGVVQWSQIIQLLMKYLENNEKIVYTWDWWGDSDVRTL